MSHYTRHLADGMHDSWWPEALWDDLYLAALFATWAFVWDDTIDTNEHILSDDLEKACAFRKESLTYVNYCLRLVDEELEEPPLPDPASALFKQFADGYCQRVGKGKKNILRHSKYYAYIDIREPPEIF